MSPHCDNTTERPVFLAVVMECRFSAGWLAGLCAAAQPPAAILVAHAGPTAFTPVPRRWYLGPPLLRVDEVAARHDIPLYRVSDWDAVPDAFLTTFPQLFVACYPRLLPAQRYADLGIAAWNIHPAPLPVLRGPDPLFYTARGDAPPSVTIHALSPSYDSGPIIALKPVHPPADCDEHGYIDAHSATAADLVVQHNSTPAASAIPQTGGAGWAAYPRAADYLVLPEWSCARTSNFIRRTNARGQAYTVAATGERFSRLDPAGSIRVPCADGTLTAFPALSTCTPV